MMLRILLDQLILLLVFKVYLLVVQSMAMVVLEQVRLWMSVESTVPCWLKMVDSLMPPPHSTQLRLFSGKR